MWLNIQEVAQFNTMTREGLLAIEQHSRGYLMARQGQCASSHFFWSSGKVISAILGVPSHDFISSSSLPRARLFKYR